jgi:hypothetical protein
MRSPLVVLATLITLTIQKPLGPSPVPICTYTCPPTDWAGRPLQEHSQSSSQLFCRYLTIPNDFFCKYDLVSFLFPFDFFSLPRFNIPWHRMGFVTVIDALFLTQDDGSLKQDHDEGKCPDQAIYTCPLKKRHALPRSPAPPSPAARSPKPQIMQTRNSLGKKKRGE